MLAEYVNPLALYLVATYIFLSLPIRYPIRCAGLAFLNITFCSYTFFYKEEAVQWWPLLACVGTVAASYICLRLYQTRPKLYGLALGLPLAVLVVMKSGAVPMALGFSYLSFRLAYLVYQVHLKKVSLPAFSNYVGYAFFPLIFMIGPISPYSLYEASLKDRNPELTPLPRALTRILVGMIKVLFIAQLFKTMNFTSLWLDGYKHGISDFIMACTCSYLYLYFNFAGACDMIIGASGVLNIRVQENFNNPLFARNIKEFWNRFHMTLGNFMRDIVYAPGVFWLSRRFGPRRLHVISVVMLLLTFFLIGVWHGTARNFLMLGLLHGIGMAVYYLYALAWKRLPPRIRRLSDTTAMRVISTLITFAFVSFTMLFFENSWPEIRFMYYYALKL